MTDVRFAQAAGAYNDALRAAERILQRAGNISASAGESSQATSGSSFGQMVAGALQNVENTGYRGEAMAMQAVQGKADLSDVVTSLADAETALTTIVSLRDKAINAYQDIIKMPI